MTAKQYLSQALRIDQRIESRIAERDRLASKATSLRATQLTGMPRGGGRDWTDAINEVIDLTSKIEDEIMELCRLKREIMATIDRVEDSRYRMLLEFRYRSGYTWEQIAEAMGYDVRWVYHLHGEALQTVKVPNTAC